MPGKATKPSCPGPAPLPGALIDGDPASSEIRKREREADGSLKERLDKKGRSAAEDPLEPQYGERLIAAPEDPRELRHGGRQSAASEDPREPRHGRTQGSAAEEDPKELPDGGRQSAAAEDPREVRHDKRGSSASEDPCELPHCERRNAAAEGSREPRQDLIQCRPAQQQYTLIQLPDEILAVILLMLDPIEVVKAAMTCQTIKRIARSITFKREYSKKHPTAQYLGVYSRESNYLSNRSTSLASQEISTNYFSEALGGLKFDMLDSAGGRLLVTIRGTTLHLHVLNPLCQTYRAIPDPSVSRQYLHHAALFGNLDSSYRILLIHYDGCQVRLSRYQSHADVWTTNRVRIPFRMPPRETLCKPTIEAGSRYYLLNYGQSVLAVDERKLTIESISLPQQQDDEVGAPHILGRTSQGELGLIVLGWKDVIHCWAYRVDEWARVWEWAPPILKQIPTPSILAFGQRSLILVVSQVISIEGPVEEIRVVLCDTGTRTTVSLLERPEILSSPMVYETGWPFHLL